MGAGRHQRSATAAGSGAKERRVQRFVAALAAFPTSRKLANPYKSLARRRNLETYLTALLAWPYSGHLLVGEAPGERGCARTGIPFTDERLLRRGDVHPFLNSLKPAVRVAGSTAESTAGIVWSHLSQCAVVPAFWNAVPFHPRSTERANRAPSRPEIDTGRYFLEELLVILSPRLVIAVGRTAERSLRAIGLSNFHAVRHPSHGGKRDFIAGLNLAGIGPTADPSSILRDNPLLAADHCGGQLGPCPAPFDGAAAEIAT